MDDIRTGARFRALRQRLGWRQQDLAERAGWSQDVISRIERGHLGSMQLDTIRGVAAELEAQLAVQLRWRGGDLDRLMDEGHAKLAGRMIEILHARSWDVRAEVSYSIYGERGSIDLPAWRPDARALLVVEVKTALVSAEETLRKHDEKVRLAARIAMEQFGWQPTTTGRLLVLPDVSTARRRMDRLASVMRAAYAMRGAAARDWLATPRGTFGGAIFISIGGRDARRPPFTQARRRVRRTSGATEPWPGRGAP